MRMHWFYDDFLKWMQKGCNTDEATTVIIFSCANNNLTNIPHEIGQLINLQTFCCNNNKLMSISPEIGKLINLKYFNCSFNNLTNIPQEIGKLINLQQFYCYNNKLTNIPLEIGQLINLQEFFCYNNKLTNIPYEIGQLINLQNFNCNNNKLTNIPQEIGKLINLQDFNCSNNILTNISVEIGQLINLQTFYCSNNNITNIPPEIGQLINLKKFNCAFNNLTNIPQEICQLVNLHNFTYNNNPIEYIPQNVVRFINRIHNHHTYTKKNQGIYGDTQSVHDHHVQQCIQKSVQYIISNKPIFSNESLNNFIIQNTILLEPTKKLLFEYIDCNNIHSILNITFGELLLSIMSIIIKHSNCDDILEIMNQEMQDAACKCFTGRISRLVNCLNGFDENIKINISDNEQIANIILQNKNKFNNLDNIKLNVTKQLLELGYTYEVIRSWTDYIE